MNKTLVIGIVIIVVLGLALFAVGFSSREDEPAKLEHRDKQYGFSFELPESWRGYSVVDSTFEARSVTSGNVVATPPLISIRSPLWTEEIPRQDIPIMVFTHDEWREVEEEELSVGAAPIPPRELGRNSNYVFALPARYNYAFPEGFEEVEQILEGNPLRTF